MGLLKFTKVLQEKHTEYVLISHNTIQERRSAPNWQVHTKHTQPYVGREVRQ